LKNALDIASRPAGQSCWAGKPGAILTVSPGHMGGFGASRHLRQVLSFLDIRMMNQPEGYIADITAALDEQGAISDERMQAHLRKAATAINDWMEQQAP
jgi:chromate reductase